MTSPWGRVTVFPSLARGHFLGWDRYDPHRWAMQPKLDGERRVCQVIGSGADSVAYFTGRRKNSVGTYEERGANLPHLRHAFGAWDGAILDGEVYIDGGTSSDVTAIMATKDPKEAKQKIDALGRPITYRIFDIIAAPGRKYLTRLPLSERMDSLKHLVREIGLPEHVKLVNMSIISNYESWYKSYIGCGGEGVVLKDRTAGYVYGPNGSWVKVKPVETTTAEVTGLQRGEGKYDRSLGALLYSTTVDGKIYTGTVSGMTDAERDQIWKSPWLYIRKKFEVEYSHAGDRALIHPRFLRWREDL